MVIQLQLRHDTAANWTAANPTLLSGEKGFETDTKKWKTGDGVTAWNSLAYEFFEIPAATTSTIGGVIVGDGLLVAPDGTISNEYGGDADTLNGKTEAQLSVASADTIGDVNGAVNQVVGGTGSGTAPAWMNIGMFEGPYMKQRTYTHNSASHTNMQIFINVYRGSGVDGIDGVYLDGQCKADYSDVRFYDITNSANLVYWMEGIYDDHAVFWIKLPSIPNGSFDIGIVYGNPSATSQSSGVNTFPFFDDFDGTAINAAKWTQVGTQGSIGVANSIANISVMSTSYHSYVAIGALDNADTVTCCKARHMGSAWYLMQDYLACGIRSDGDTVGAKTKLRCLANGATRCDLINYIEGGAEQGYNQLNPASYVVQLTDWVRFEIRHNYTDTFYKRIIGGSATWIYYAINPVGTKLWFGARSSGSTVMVAEFDWIFQRAYDSHEPTPTETDAAITASSAIQTAVYS